MLSTPNYMDAWNQGWIMRYRGPYESDGVSRPRLRGNQRAIRPSDPAEAAWRQLEPEYYRRVRLHGKAKADRWLVATGREMGRRHGLAAREKLRRR
jgi:hypothetical protein